MEDVADLIDFAKAYADLGWAVQEQFDKLMDGDFEGLNHNAVKLMEKLGEFHQDIADRLDEYKEFCEEDED